MPPDISNTVAACVVCGCTEDTPCIDQATGETCGWSLRSFAPLCTFCAENGERLVQLFSETEGDQFIRAMKAGA